MGQKKILCKWQNTVKITFSFIKAVFPWDMCCQAVSLASQRLGRYMEFLVFTLQLKIRVLSQKTYFLHCPLLNRKTQFTSNQQWGKGICYVKVLYLCMLHLCLSSYFKSNITILMTKCHRTIYNITIPSDIAHFKTNILQYFPRLALDCESSWLGKFLYCGFCWTDSVPQ